MRALRRFGAILGSPGVMVLTYIYVTTLAALEASFDWWSITLGSMATLVTFRVAEWSINRWLKSKRKRTIVVTMRGEAMRQYLCGKVSAEMADALLADARGRDAEVKIV